MSIISRTAPLVRHEVPNLDALTFCNAGSVSAQVKALSGVGDLDLVRDAMINRFARVIVAEKDETTSATTSTVYRSSARLKLDHATKEAILAGQQEIVRFYLFNSIVRQRATLFTEPTQRYEYESAGSDEIMGEVRDEGQANIAAQRWDTYADGCGSCALYISDAGGSISYTEIPPHQFWFAHAETILDGTLERPTNTNALDEASIVAIELASFSDKRRFAAWFGPCDKWELGRHVVYYAESWYDIPEPGESDAYEYSASAKGFVRAALDCANPLTLIARSQGAESGPTYPIAICYSDSMQSGLMPTSSTLYEICAELDLMGSMVVGAAGRGARGTDVLKRRDNSSPVPDQTGEGLVLIGRDDEFAKSGWPASHSKDALAVIDGFARHIAESYSVPGWLVVADQSGEVPSGVALEIMTLPLTRNRMSRIEMNRHSVARRFEIERLIINGAVGKAAISYDERETWHAGERVWPVDPVVALTAWEKRIAMGEADLGDVVQTMRGLRTHEEAINWLEERDAVRQENPLIANKAAPAVTTKPTLAERLKKPSAEGTPIAEGTKREEKKEGKNV